jgi:superfamily II DNA or RNA helicase
MGYQDLSIQRSYKTNKNDIVKEFYVPILKNSVLYKRAVGFFSSTALVELSKGIAGLVKNGGKIKFIVSPLLSEEDIAAIQKGYDERGIVERALLREFREPKNASDEERLNWLANLIASGAMEIKVAFTPPSKTTGMYHEKIGLLYDTEGNMVAFTGSMNETINAFHNNYESIVVFNSLVEEDKQRVRDLEYDFDSLWAGHEDNVSVIDFPKVVKEKLISYKKDAVNLDLDAAEIENNYEAYPLTPGIPTMPKGVDLHDYQKEAINTWADKDYCGIFDMATGTGKTYTGLGAAVRLFQDKKRLALIIVCPYQHLVEQWVEDIEKFNMRPTIGYSASKQTDWKKRLANDIMDFKLDVIKSFCFVTTNATFSSEYVQKQINKLGRDTLLLVDEAHNFGADNLRRMLNPKIEYRLALSATLERHGDPEGTQALYDYFGEKCIEYDLARAIREGKLTPYYYYPKVVYLTDEELDIYRELSKKVVKQCHQKADGTYEITEFGKKLLIERARVVAGASNKVHLLRSLMEEYKNETHMLIYCGAARSFDFSSDNSERDEEGERQIVSVSKMLGLELGMKVTHFTSSESAREREEIKRQFADADPYQAIVAIKCLDEGVNIPSIKTAFILASSTNPKEYVQRRGRVLRKAPNKPYATIFDFITLPTPLEYVSSESENARFDLSLIKKEIIRMKEFGEISKNPAEADKLINTLMEVYGLDTITEEEYFDE